MRLSRLSLAIVLAALAVCSAQADKPVHLFVLSGQSNMAGMNPAAGFLPEAATLLPDAEIAHLKVAAGGQPIRLWVAEWNEISKAAGIELANDKTPFYDRILAGYRSLLEKHGNFASVTFCWMQGEKDAKTGLAAAYEASLKQLIANLRRDLEQPNLNFVIGRLSDHSPAAKSQAGWDQVREIHVKIANEDERGAWVDTDDLNDKEKNGVKRDDLHYTKEGYALFGRRLARQAVKLIQGEKPAEDGRPQ